MPNTDAGAQVIEREARLIERSDLAPRNLNGGNFVVTIGWAGSGKTTFQNFLIRYIDERLKRVGFRMLPKEVEDAADAERLLDAWRQSWREGHFQLSNATKPPGQYSFKVIPPDKSRFKKNLEFGFVEIDGEQFGSLVPSLIKKKAEGLVQRLGQNIQRKKSEPVMPPSILSLLSNNKVQPFIVLVCDGEELGRMERRPTDDELFTAFLQFVEHRLRDGSIKRLRKEARIMILVSKPDEARRALDSLLELGHPEDLSIARRVAKLYLPNTLVEIEQGWKQKPYITSLNLGETEGEGDDRRLVEPNYRNISRIFDVMYERMTHSSTKLGFWQKLFSQ